MWNDYFSSQRYTMLKYPSATEKRRYIKLGMCVKLYTDVKNDVFSARQVTAIKR